MAYVEEHDDGSVTIKHKPIPDVPFYDNWLTFLLSRCAAFWTKEKDTREGSETFGHEIDVIKPLDRHQEQAVTLVNATNGIEVDVTCICCGNRVPYQEAMVAVTRTRFSKTGANRSGIKQFSGRIRIGAFVQFPITTRIDVLTEERKFQRKPVAKEGLGCADCQALMIAAEAEMERVNVSRRREAVVMAELHDAKQFVAALKTPKPDLTDRCIHNMPRCMCAAFACNPRKQATAKIKLPQDLKAWIDVSDRLGDAPKHDDALAHIGGTINNEGNRNLQ